MKRTTTNLTLALLLVGTLSFSTEAFADHTRTVRRVYESNRLDLDEDYRARRKANTYEYHRERDALRAARTRAARIDCPETRSRRIRAINLDLASLSRDYNARNRELSNWYHTTRRALHNDYEVARRHARTLASRPVIVESVSTVHGHPADCSCNVCVPVVAPVVVERPVVPAIETCPNAVPSFDRGYRGGYGLEGRDLRLDHDLRNDRRYRSEFDGRSLRDGYDRGFTPASYRRTPSNVNWANLIFSLIN